MAEMLSEWMGEAGKFFDRPALPLQIKKYFTDFAKPYQSGNVVGGVAKDFLSPVGGFLKVTGGGVSIGVSPLVGIGAAGIAGIIGEDWVGTDSAILGFFIGLGGAIQFGASLIAEGCMNLLFAPLNFFKIPARLVVTLVSNIEEDIHQNSDEEENQPFLNVVEEIKGSNAIKLLAEQGIEITNNDEKNLEDAKEKAKQIHKQYRNNSNLNETIDPNVENDLYQNIKQTENPDSEALKEYFNLFNK